jgi:hypothetical protein
MKFFVLLHEDTVSTANVIGPHRRIRWDDDHGVDKNLDG